MTQSSQITPTVESPAELTAQLLSRVALGDSCAMEQVVLGNTGFVRSLARRFLRHSQDIEDAVQEIFLSLWDSARRFDPLKGSATTFIATLARRRLIDRLRHSRRRPEMMPIEAASEMIERPLDHDLREESDRVRRALFQLPSSQRRVLARALLKGETHVEIARHTELPLGTVKSHARRGLIRLRELLAPGPALAC